MSDITFEKADNGTNANISTITIGGVAIVISGDGSTEMDGKAVVSLIKSLVENGTATADIDGTKHKLTNVGGITTIDDTTADDIKALFADLLPESYSWNFDTAAGKIGINVDDTKTDSTFTLTISQVSSDTANYTSDPDAVTFTGTAYKAATEGKVTVDFGDGLLAGQSYTFNGKTVVATADLTGEEVAEAFTYKQGEAFDGAVIVSNWKTANIVESKVAYGINGSELTILDQGTTGPGTPSGILSPVLTDVITGTGALAVNIKNVSASTTKQGQVEEQILADSYITAVVAEAGKGASGAEAGVATKIVANTNALDTITNFDISNDKLALNKFDVSGDGTAGRYVATEGASFGALSGDAIYLDTLGSTLAASASAGIISFGINAGSGATAGADTITLEHKLFAAIGNMGNNKVAGFEHSGDFYVIATGGNGSVTTDDLVIKLAGVSGITDIGTILG